MLQYDKVRMIIIVPCNVPYLKGEMLYHDEVDPSLHQVYL